MNGRRAKRKATVKKRLNRKDLYFMICKRLRLESKAMGYFSTKDLRLILEYIIKTEGENTNVDNNVLPVRI